MQTDSVGKQREGGSGFGHLSYGPEDQNSELKALTAPLWEKIGGQLTAGTMSSLTADQITLLAYEILRRELLEGGFVQLIQNGYGSFIFLNPFARALREWGQSLENAPATGGTIANNADDAPMSNGLVVQNTDDAPATGGTVAHNADDAPASNGLVSHNADDAPASNGLAILKDFSKWLYRARKVYERTRSLLERPTRDQDEFMALYEKVEEWDEFDDEFVDQEPEVTKAVIEAWRLRANAQGDC